jgi:hypothetical protein
MRLSSLIGLLVIVGTTPVAGGAPVSKDSLTQLPLDPATGGLFGGDRADENSGHAVLEEHRLDEFLRVISNEKMEATVAWYAANVNGFNHSHGCAAGRTRDVLQP